MADWIERTTALIALHPGRPIGMDLPKMGRFTEQNGLLLARAAPHQVLAMRHGVDQPLMDELAPLTRGTSLIDLSDARVGLRLEGPRARARLALLVPLDLHPTRFQPGMCAQTLMAHLNVLLLQTGPDAYELQCGRSFAESFRRAVAATPEASPLARPPPTA